MNRPRRDIDDLDNLFDRNEAERRRQDRAAVVETARIRTQQLEEQEAADRARVKESMRQATNEFLIREYEHAGVTPPKVNGDGVPTCSLALLLRMGWKIEELEHGSKVLTAPASVPQKGRSTP